MARTRVVNVRSGEGYDIYVGRPNRTYGRSIWGNPYREGIHGTRAEVIAKYRLYVTRNTYLMERLDRLKGKRLGCYCFPLPCHADVLVELVEGGGSDAQ